MLLAKYSANGNDFLIFHTLKKGDRAELAKKVCHRQNGIGADGLIVLVPSGDFDYEWEFYNSDGSLADMCGNGSRAAGLYAYQNNIAPLKHSFSNGKGREIRIEIKADSQNCKNYIVESNLGRYKILDNDIEESNLKWQKIDTGVPHMVTFIEAKKDEPQKEILRNIRNAYDANVNLARIVSAKIVRVKTYERGVEDITLACGTGMAAVFISALKRGKIENPCTIIPPGGDEISVRLDGEDILFSGSVKKVSECVIDI